jgi:hypothetical protein
MPGVHLSGERAVCLNHEERKVRGELPEGAGNAVQRLRGVGEAARAGILVAGGLAGCVVSG